MPTCATLRADEEKRGVTVYVITEMTCVHRLFWVGFSQLCYNLDIELEKLLLVDLPLLIERTLTVLLKVCRFDETYASS